jgi:hypothetical protein
VRGQEGRDARKPAPPVAGREDEEVILASSTEQFVVVDT